MRCDECGEKEATFKVWIHRKTTCDSDFCSDECLKKYAQKRGWTYSRKENKLKKKDEEISLNSEQTKPNDNSDSIADSGGQDKTAPSNSNEEILKEVLKKYKLDKMTEGEFKIYDKDSFLDRAIKKAIKKALSKKDEEYLSKLRELKDKIEDAQEDYANLDWVSKDQAIKIIDTLFPKLKEEKSP